MSDRRLHQCRYGGCDSEAKWTLCVMIPLHSNIVTREQKFFRCESTVARCERHIQIAVDNVLSPQQQQNIRIAARKEGHAAPNFEHARIVVVPIGEQPLPDVI
jgi:hypothetical protein